MQNILHITCKTDVWAIGFCLKSSCSWTTLIRIAEFPLNLTICWAPIKAKFRKHAPKQYTRGIHYCFRRESAEHGNSVIHQQGKTKTRHEQASTKCFINDCTEQKHKKYGSRLETLASGSLKETWELAELIVAHATWLIIWLTKQHEKILDVTPVWYLVQCNFSNLVLSEKLQTFPISRTAQPMHCQQHLKDEI